MWAVGLLSLATSTGPSLLITAFLDDQLRKTKELMNKSRGRYKDLLSLPLV